jgi:TPR repeat protein
MLGVMYTYGQGIDVNLELAVEYFTLSCKHNEDAKYHLGNFFLTGAGGLNKSSACAKLYLHDLQNFSDVHTRWEVFKKMRLVEDVS